MASPTKQRFSQHEPYSNLEVAPTEHATQAPEIHFDPAATAPERDFSSDSPEFDQKTWPLASPNVRILWHQEFRNNADELASQDHPVSEILM